MKTLKEFLEIEEAMRGLTQVGIEIKHHFAEGIYCREMFCPAGVIIMGKIHKTEHLNILSMGKVAVSTPEGATNVYEAPCMIHSDPGTKRVLYALTDYVWTNIHHNPTNCRDKMELEDIFIEDPTPIIEAIKRERLEGSMEVSV